jgi:hypothetical protein
MHSPISCRISCKSGVMRLASTDSGQGASLDKMRPRERDLTMTPIPFDLPRPDCCIQR